MISPLEKLILNRTILVSNVNFLNLFSEDDGGAILVLDFDHLIEVSISRFCNCSSLGAGGAIYSPCKEVTIKSTATSKCNAANFPTFYIYHKSENLKINISQCAIFRCVSKANASISMCVSGSTNIKNLNQTNSETKHISGILFSDPSTEMQSLSYSHFENNTAVQFGGQIQYNTGFLCKLFKNNIIGADEQGIKCYAIRFVGSPTLTIEDCMFMKNFVAAFIKNSDSAPSISILNSYRSEDFPIGLGDINLEFIPLAPTADVRFNLDLNCCFGVMSSQAFAKVKIIVVAFLFAVVNSEGIFCHKQK